MVNLQKSYDELRRILDSQIEWLLIHANGASFALQTNEIELELKGEKIILGFLSSQGFQIWRIVSWKTEKHKVFIELSRNFGREKIKLQLVPRTLSDDLTENIELVRLEKAQKLAHLLISYQEKAKLIRVELNKENGRFAHIIFENRSKSQTAVLADVSNALTPEVLLTTAILWLKNLSIRKRNPIENAWILSEKKTAKKLQKLHALLQKDWKRKIKIFEFSGFESKEKSIDIKELESPGFQTLFKKKSKKVKVIETGSMSETAQKIIEISPEEIDTMQTKNGETIYFKGLAFARVRKVLQSERVWFGTETNRRVLSGDNFGEFTKLIEELKIYRQHNSPNKQHIFYKYAPEAWLESILRKNIKLLDSNLVLSPLYNQFRAECDKIDLMAIRRDGRLVIIEVKTAPDREMIFQAADYWRKIETERRSENLKKSRIFGNLEIKDETALVYLVAPMLSYHRDFQTLAQTISPDIEIFRFDINENWRDILKVVRREKISEFAKV